MNNNQKMVLKQLSHLLFLPEEELLQLMNKYEIKEIRQRNFHWIEFFLVNLRCIINGKSRHKDRSGLYKQLFGTRLSTNSFSDRLSQLPTDFCRDLLKRIQVHLNRISCSSKKTRTTNIVNTLLAEDATVFHLDKRLLNSFGSTGHKENVGLKLYLSLNVLGDVGLEGEIKKGNSSDVHHKGSWPHGKGKCVEVRDLAWFSYKSFSEWKSEGRYFISRIKKRINPQILRVNQGSKSFEGMRFQEIPWDTASGEIDMEVMPFRDDKGNVYRLKDGSTLTLNMRGRKQPGQNQWFWYIYNLPNGWRLTFEDIHSLYRARWRIEECFRELKQALGGDKLRLRHPVSVQNHILMMLIAYLICKGYIIKISNAHKKSVRGFMLDSCLQGTVGELFKSVIFTLIRDPLLSNVKLKEISEAFCETAYSAKRARSGRIIKWGKAMKRLNA